MAMVIQRRQKKSPDASKIRTNTMVNMIQKYAGKAESPLIHRWEGRRIG